MKEIIEKEIKWCEEHRGMKSEVYEEGFIAGLKQVLFLINTAQQSVHMEKMDMVTFVKKHSEWYDIIDTMRAIESIPVSDLLQMAFSAGIKAAEERLLPSLFTKTVKYCTPVNGIHAAWCPDDKKDRP